MKKKILICPPDYYDIEYVLNPWMDLSNKVDRAKVQSQYKELKSTYESLGVTVYELPQEKSLPDMVYTANHGYGEDKLFIKANLKYPERKKESEFTTKLFKDLGYSIETLPETIDFEGEGDLIRSDNKYFLGWGKRTNPEALKYLEKILGKPLIDFEMIDPFTYHLDTCFAPLNDDIVVLNPAAFKPESLEVIKKTFPEIIEVKEEKDLKLMVCNLVVVGKNVVIGKGISDVLRGQIEKFGFKIHEIDTSEYLKGGGSVKCLSLEIF